MMDAIRADLALLAASLDAEGPAEVAACHHQFDPAVLRLASLLTLDGLAALSVAEVVDLRYLLAKAVRSPVPPTA